MAAWYDVILKDGPREKYRGVACFSEYYSTPEFVHKWIVYVPKSETKDLKSGDEYGDYSYTHETIHSEEELREYTNLLREIGFNIRFREARGWDKVWAFEISGNSTIATLILLNIIRNIYEDGRSITVTKFLKLAKEDSSLGLFARLQIAQYTHREWMGHGHTILPCYKLLKLLSDDEVKELILDEQDDYETTYVQDYLPTIGNSADARIVIDTVFGGGSLAKILEVYPGEHREAVTSV